MGEQVGGEQFWKRGNKHTQKRKRAGIGHEERKGMLGSVRVSC